MGRSSHISTKARPNSAYLNVKKKDQITDVIFSEKVICEFNSKIYNSFNDKKY